MKNITIKQKEYFDKNDIEIEVEETITEPVVKKNIVTVGNIQATIKELKRRKKESNDKFDSEIELNQSLLDSVKTEVDAVSISTRVDKQIN